MIDALLWLIALPPALLSTFLAVEVMAGLRPLAGTTSGPDDSAPSAAIVIPAHDEEASIAATLAALTAESDGLARILVVADNCADRTAELVRAAGVRCVERNDPTARGKGYALAFARDSLAADPPRVVLIVDADCRIDRASIAALIAAADVAQRPAQAVNLLQPDLSAPPFVQMSNFAFMIRNLVRQRGLQRLARRVHLTGTGMALPWSLFSEAELGGASIVEDLELGLTLAASGQAPILVEGATVWSPAASAGGTLKQRERWEGGFIKQGIAAGLKAIARTIANRDGRGLVGAIDLCVPPLVLMGLVDVAAVAITGVAAALGGSSGPCALMIATSGLAGVAVIVAWFLEGRRFASPGALLMIPVYIVRKLPMYGRILIRGAPRDWVRSDRVQ